MKLTISQKNLLNNKKMTKIIFKKMFKNKKELGYTVLDKNLLYTVHLASDAPTKDVQTIVLLHELGHIQLLHIDKNIPEEINYIKNLLINKNKSIETFCRKYKGFFTFINICMDLEVNSKFLTYANIQYMKKYFELCTIENFKVTFRNSYKDYYEPLIDRLPDKNEEINKDEFEDDSLSEFFNDFSFEDLSFNKKKVFKEIEKTLSDIISNEDYLAGDDRNIVDKRDYVGESSLQSFIETSNLIDDYKKVSRKSSIDIIADKSEQKIEDFLKRILDVDAVYREDPLKHFNRKTRGTSNGILYNSLRRKHEYNSKKNLGILVDVSYSMKTSEIIKAANTLKNYSVYLSDSSSVITWDTDLVEEFNIQNIPNKIKTGNSTEISSGLTYLINKGFTDIVIYSDFETDIGRLVSVFTKNPEIKLYFIVSKNTSKKKFLDETFKDVSILYI